MATIKPTSNISTSQLKPAPVRCRRGPHHQGGMPPPADRRATSNGCTGLFGPRHSPCLTRAAAMSRGHAANRCEPPTGGDPSWLACGCCLYAGITFPLDARAFPARETLHQPTARYTAGSSSSSPRRCDRPVLGAFFLRKSGVLRVFINSRKSLRFRESWILPALLIDKLLKLRAPTSDYRPPKPDDRR